MGAIKFDHSVGLRVFHVIGKNGGALGASHGLLQEAGQVVTVEKIVPQNQRGRFAAKELFPDQKGLGQTVWRGLLGVGKLQPPATAIAQQVAE